MAGTPELLPATPAAPPDLRPLVEDVLRVVHLSSAVFLRGEFSAPWAFSSLGPRECAAALCPEAERLVLFHVVLEGRCRVKLDAGDEAVLRAGEAVVIPYGDAHQMAEPADARPVPVATLLPPLPWSSIAVLRHGGGGASTRVLCGYLHCEDLLFHPVLRALPPLVPIRPATAAAADWLRASALYTAAQVGLGGAAPARLPELLLVDCLRQCVETLPASRLGWLAAARDPLVGRALALLHGAPADPWSVEALARRVAASRTVLAERFVSLLGVPPMRYLTQWRLQLAAHLLRGAPATLPEIAGKVGYVSEAAFCRAFKREMGIPPATWRDRHHPGA